MDRATAERLDREFLVAVKDWEKFNETARYDWITPIGFSGDPLHPSGLLMKTDAVDDQHFIVPFVKKKAGYAFAAREAWQAIRISLRLVDRRGVTSITQTAASTEPESKEQPESKDLSVTTDASELRSRRKQRLDAATGFPTSVFSSGAKRSTTSPPTLPIRQISTR